MKKSTSSNKSFTNFAPLEITNPEQIKGGQETIIVEDTGAN